MEKLNELIEFYEMTGDDPQLLIWLIELRRHRENNWQQRAEAAEAKLATAERAIDNLDAERSAMRAKLAELEKQEPVAYWHHSGQVVTRDECTNDEIFAICCKVERPLYTRPAPAVSLLGLVPPESPPDEIMMLKSNSVDASCKRGGVINGWAACRAALLRNIEEAG